MAIEIPRLLAISDRRLLGSRSFGDWVRELAEAGVEGLQIREKHLADRDLLELAIAARRAAGEAMSVLVNGRADVALAAGCDGVHLPASGVPSATLRHRFGDRLMIGCSTHRVGEVTAAGRDGADYVVFGPVYETPSKAAYGPPPGLPGLRRAVARGVPVIALGGVEAGRLAEVAQAGVAGAAGIRAFHDPEELCRLVAAARRFFPPLPADGAGWERGTGVEGPPRASASDPNSCR